MKIRILYLSMFLFYACAFTYSQSTAESKDSLLNIFSTFNAGITKPGSVGTETSGFFYYTEYPWIETYGVSLALYRGVSFSFERMKQSINEHSPLYHTYNLNPTEYRYSNTFMFFDPGLSIYSMNRKYSLDLYKRLDTQIYINGQQQLAPLKLNYHF